MVKGNNNLLFNVLPYSMITLNHKRDRHFDKKLIPKTKDRKISSSSFILLFDFVCTPKLIVRGPSLNKFPTLIRQQIRFLYISKYRAPMHYCESSVQKLYSVNSDTTAKFRDNKACFSRAPLFMYCFSMVEEQKGRGRP